MQINLWALLVVVLVQYTGVYSHWRTLTKSRRTAVRFFSYVVFGTRSRQGVKFTAILLSSLALCSSGIGAWANPELVWQVVYSVVVAGAPFDPQAALNAVIMLGSFHTAGYLIDSKAHGMKGADNGAT